jgi:hypothetical protein
MISTITLNKTEQRLARYIAKCRFIFNRKNGIDNPDVGPQKFDETELQGVGGELSFCRMANIYPDMDTEHHPYYDVVIDGLKADIKSTVRTNGNLIVQIWKVTHPPDIYILMTGRFPVYNYRGWTRANELLQVRNLKDFGYGPCYFFPVSRLMEGLPTMRRFTE